MAVYDTFAHSYQSKWHHKTYNVFSILCVGAK